MYTENILNANAIKLSNIPDKTIKVAMFTDVLKENIDGVSNTIYNSIKHIKGIEFLFITPYPPESAFKYRVFCCPYIAFPLNNTYRFALPHFSQSLKQELDEFGPDVIHFTTPSLLGFYAVKYAEGNNIPLAGTYHTHFAMYVKYYFRFFSGLSKFIQKLAWRITSWFYNRCKVALVPTAPIRNDMVEAGIDGKRLFIWGRGVNHALYNPSRRDGVFIDNVTGKGKKRILFVSRIVMEKDLKTLISVYDRLTAIRDDVVFIVTGEGPSLQYLKRKMPKAVFTGSLVKEDLARIYASSDVFVFPSITETFGNVVLEAMASGLPVVAAAKGGPMGIIQDGKTGYLAEPENPDDFSTKILYLLENPGEAKKIGEEARAYALMQNWESLSAEIKKYYEMLAGENLRIQYESKTK